MRTHIAIPEDLIDEIDQRAGPRGRSQFVVEAIREKLEHEQLGEALEKYAGALKHEKHPEWATSEDVSKWVHDGRDADRRPAREFP